MGQIPVDAHFRSIGWSPVTHGSHEYGVVAGGLTDGTVALWDPHAIINEGMGSQSPSRGVMYPICRIQVHGGQSVSCLEFNPQKSSLLGTGGCDGTVQVVNIDRPTHPDVFHNVTTTKHLNSEVVCISWNRKVQHILASSSNQGLTVVWDLKNKKEVISFKDPANRSRCSALSWNPEVPTQLLVAYNDDNNPCIQLWDMRNCSYPFKEFQEHSRGITTASYCEHDPNLIISSGRDNRTICWCLNEDQLQHYSDINIGSPAAKIDWSPHMPGFIAASTANGAVSVHSVLQRQSPAASRYAPKWVQMPCGASFGFGGKLAIFGSKQTSRIHIDVVPDEPGVTQEADKFESYLSTDLRPFCSVMHESSIDEHEKLTWRLLSIISNSSTDYQNIVAALGINVSGVRPAVDKYLGKDTVRSGPSGTSPHPSVAHVDPVSFSDPTALNPDQLDNLFDQLAKNTENLQHSPPLSVSSRRGTPRALGGGADEIGDVTDWSRGPEHLIKQSILIGDFKGAVECCMRCGRYADALLLAASGGADLWDKTRQEYTTKQKDPFVRQIGYIIANELDKLVIQSDLTEWPETLAILVTFAGNENYARLVELLAGRLERERFDVRSAVLCYMACGSFDHTVRIWASMSHTQTSQNQALQGLVEKMSCLYAAIRPQVLGPIFCHKLTQYATLLANSGRTLTAMRLLMLVPDNVESKILKERIYNASPSIMSQLVRSPPPFPFEYMDIKPVYLSTPAAHVGPSQRALGGFAPQAHPHAHMPTGPVRGNIPTHVQQNPPADGSNPLRSSVASSPAHPSLPSRPPSGSLSSGNPASFTGQSINSMAPQEQPAQRSALPLHRSQAPTGPGPVNHQVPHVSQGQTERQPQQHSNTSFPQRQSSSQQSIPQRSVPPPGSTGLALGPHPSGLNANQSNSGINPMSVGLQPAAVQAQGNLPQRVVTGPPTSGGVSTAPHVTARSVTAGMPVPWPVPTAVQQQLTPNSVAPPAGAPVASVAISEPMSSAEVAVIQQSLSSLLQRCAQDGNTRKWEDTGRKLNDLFDKLSKGQITTESRDKVKELVACVDRGDFQSASRLRVDLSASDWERNRTWLFALQLLLPK
jgi:protein transport protein SEC31